MAACSRESCHQSLRQLSRCTPPSTTTAPTPGASFTRSPYATAFAVANRPIEGWSEAFGIFGLEDGVPVAAYGPRGSAQAIANIRAAMTPKTKAVLLANHGVLTWGPQAPLAVQLGVIIEEAAQSAVLASAIGGAKVVPAHLLHASLERHARFDKAGAARVTGTERPNP